MKATKTMMALVASLATFGCADPGFGVDLTGLWIANSYEYRSDTGTNVDLIQRDGASMSLTVDFRGDGTRRASVLFNDGLGGSETMTGDVDLDAGTFTFPNVTFQFSRNDEVLTLVDTNATFDFGSGDEPARLTIRLTQL